MFNPQMFGVSSEQMQAAHGLGQRLKVEIHKCAREGQIEIKYLPVNPEDQEAQAMAANMVENWATQMAYLHDSFFNMKGEIIEED